MVTIDDVAARLRDTGSTRDASTAIRELRRLGWLVRLATSGTWAFIPPGQDELTDPYLPLRAWLVTDPDSGMRLAGEAAAWHLGYLDRAPHGKVRVWLPAGSRVPDGLRAHVHAIRIPWNDTQTGLVEPTARLLISRHLDLVSWASGLPAFGPEALLVQLAARPGSFTPWADLLTHLEVLVDDCADDRLALLLAGQSTAAWARAAYLLRAGGSPTRGTALFDRRPGRRIPKTYFGTSAEDRARRPVFVAEYGLIDRLVAPLQQAIGKA